VGDVDPRLCRWSAWASSRSASRSRGDARGPPEEVRGDWVFRDRPAVHQSTPRLAQILRELSITVVSASLRNIL